MSLCIYTYEFLLSICQMLCILVQGRRHVCSIARSWIVVIDADWLEAQSRLARSRFQSKQAEMRRC